MTPFAKSVFVNCPFDPGYAPILKAICFCVTLMGFHPRLAPENADNAAQRLDRIVDLIRQSKYGIHDISRCRAATAGEYARMNMPFELGIDFGCYRFGPGSPEKAILVLEDQRYDYRQGLSDIAGWDIEAHGGSFEKAIRAVRSWLIAKAGAPRIGPSLIETKYATFQGWYVEREIASGASQQDILEFPTSEFVGAMQDWMTAEQPNRFN